VFSAKSNARKLCPYVPKPYFRVATGHFMCLRFAVLMDRRRLSGSVEWPPFFQCAVLTDSPLDRFFRNLCRTWRSFVHSDIRFSLHRFASPIPGRRICTMCGRITESAPSQFERGWKLRTRFQHHHGITSIDTPENLQTDPSNKPRKSALA
jgi:hypothetical protein